MVPSGRAISLVGKRLIMRSRLAFLKNKEEGGSAPSARMTSRTTFLMSSNSSWLAGRSEIERIVQ